MKSQKSILPSDICIMIYHNIMRAINHIHGSNYQKQG